MTMTFSLFQPIEIRVRSIGADALKVNQLNLKIKRNEVNSMQLQYKPSLQPKFACLPKSVPRPTLVARWEIEDDKLICRWVVDDAR